MGPPRKSVRDGVRRLSASPYRRRILGLKAEVAPGEGHRIGPSGPRCCHSETWIRVATVRALRASGQRPPHGCLLHERRNGKFALQVTGHPEFGLPWDQDRLVPIFLATPAIRQQSQPVSFASAAEMLDTFGMQQGGAQYRRLIESFRRVFGATIFFGTDVQPKPAQVIHQSRFNFMSEARIWYSRHTQQPTLSGELRNMIVLSAEFFREVMEHPVPTDLEATKVLSGAPAALDLFTWLSYRCFVSKREERVPLFGDCGLANQLGSIDYARPRKFREKLETWLKLVRAMWPGCPARIADNGTELIVSSAIALHPAANAQYSRA